MQYQSPLGAGQSVHEFALTLLELLHALREFYVALPQLEHLTVVHWRYYDSGATSDMAGVDRGLALEEQRLLEFHLFFLESLDFLLELCVLEH